MAHGECRSAGGLEEKRAEASLADADTAGPLKIAGAFQLYQQAVGELRLAQVPQVQAAFSREGPLSAWVVIWLMIYQRLHAKGTLSIAVGELLTGAGGSLDRKS